MLDINNLLVVNKTLCHKHVKIKTGELNYSYKLRLLYGKLNSFTFFQTAIDVFVKFSAL